MLTLTKKVLLVLSCLILMAGTCLADADKPGQGVTVKPARATWNTGYFQDTLLRKALTELGYKVEKPKELQNPIFYQTVALGDVDYWPNGWFPNHDCQLPKGFYDKADKYGYVVKAGGLQGYLVSKDLAEKMNIKSLDDFKRDDVKKVFDSNKDGKADLVACPPGWGCEKVITHHFKVYDLKDHINPIKASYSASMAETIAKFKNNEPIFFYTWAPNWTIHKLQPGKDVVWINVPEINPSEGQVAGKDRMTVSGIEGAITDPVKLGFVVSDIQVVANKKFIEANPAAKKLFEIFNLSLADIAAQNTRMFEGEDSANDVARHADEWIEKNKETWDSWLKAARDAAK